MTTEPCYHCPCGNSVLAHQVETRTSGTLAEVIVYPGMLVCRECGKQMKPRVDAAWIARERREAPKLDADAPARPEDQHGQRPQDS